VTKKDGFMPNTAASKIDLLKGIEELFVGTLLVFFRMIKTSLIFLVRPRDLIEYLSDGASQSDDAYILPHHVHIVRPMTYATLCSISFFFISILLIVKIKSGAYGLPTIDMPTINEVTELINQLSSQPLSQIILFELPYVMGVVVAGGVSRFLLFGAELRFSYLTSLYLSGYFFGVSLLVVTMACLCFVTIAYLFSGTGDILYNVTMFAIYMFPLLISIVTLLVHVQMYRCLKQLSGLAWWRCMLATTMATLIFSLSVGVGVSFMGM
jgi:hypothetical protein